MEHNLPSQAMQQIIDGTLNIDYMSVKQIIETYGHLLNEKELEMLQAYNDGD